MNAYLCMDDDELQGWLRAAKRVHNGGRNPCVDCPLAYHLSMKAEGRCDRAPITSVFHPKGGRPRVPTYSPFVARRRTQQRNYMRRQRGLPEDPVPEVAA